MIKSKRVFDYYLTTEGHLLKYEVMSDEDTPIKKMKRQKQEQHLCKMKWCLNFNNCDKKEINGVVNNVNVRCVNYGIIKKNK